MSSASYTLVTMDKPLLDQNRVKGFRCLYIINTISFLLKDNMFVVFLMNRLVQFSPCVFVFLVLGIPSWQGDGVSSMHYSQLYLKSYIEQFTNNPRKREVP